MDRDRRQTLFYEKVTWTIDAVQKGLRYGENPGQEAALYRMVNGNLVLGETETIQPGKFLASDIELLQSGKHPGKTNLTDADNSLNILRYFVDKPTAVIVKHNNPCGVAQADSLEDAYVKANMADRVAAFGGCIALNRAVDKSAAEAITSQYAEVVVAPGFDSAALEIFAKKKNLRVLEADAADDGDAALLIQPLVEVLAHDADLEAFKWFFDRRQVIGHGFLRRGRVALGMPYCEHDLPRDRRQRPRSVCPDRGCRAHVR